MSIPAAYIGVIIIWSTTPLAIKWSGDEVGFLFGLTGRMVLGVGFCLLIALLFRIKLPWHQQARRTYLAAGLGLFLAMLSVYWSSQFIPSGWISVIFGLTPILTGVMASFWLTEQALTPSRLAGMLLGVSGLVLIFSSSWSLGPEAALGIAGVLLSATVHSASAVAVKRIDAQLPGLVVTTGALMVAVPLYLGVFFLMGEPIPTAIPERALASILYLGIVGSVLGFALYFYVLRRVEVTRVALITLLTPVIALLLGNGLNGELVTAEVWGGTAMILSGLVLFEYGHLLHRQSSSGQSGIRPS